MMNFTSHEIMLEHINTRTEHHGDDEVLTLDLKITFDLPNTSLDQLSPTLRSSLYDRDDTGDMIDPDNMPNLRNPQLGLLRWTGKWSPVLFVFDATDDEDDDLRFHDAKLDRLTFLAKHGGTCSYSARIQVHPEDTDISARILNRLHAPDARGTLEASDEALNGSDGDDG
ncbi:hypothetical protein F6X37_11005 [Paraburkholderia sp. 31.1]|uniref:hypothetical protein n=1 Tax=Paraburkholderia sp. 31.1 TaxID=2615205 RepID=UPI00165635CF|nr:hypothetical protein [Paraburkholderia sp. 31.1]MBC8722102.1 hypothetical protein [Paraburkholderia sp. 31.1]